VKLFPSDPLILFYAGTLHETYATPRYQNAPRLQNIKYSHGLKKTELELARNFFREPSQPIQISLRPGCDLDMFQGCLAITTRRLWSCKRLRAPSRSQIQYYAALFLGNELAVLGRTAEARKQFERAAALYPAHNPLIGVKPAGS